MEEIFSSPSLKTTKSNKVYQNVRKNDEHEEGDLEREGFK